AGWSIFTSLPQPLMALPAFLFVLVFEPFLPIGLGLAAGAMIWMVFAELVPDALE
ncbi:MAG: ZIP family metal transporter, partial [Salinibacter sp.]